MKKLITTYMAMTAMLCMYGQAKKNSIQKQPTKAYADSPLDAQTAGKYAKSLGNRIYNTDPVYGDKHRGFSLNIIDWKPIRDLAGKYLYLIKVDMNWQEGTGGFGDWKSVSYTGHIIADEFGCNAIYFIKEKEEPSAFGLMKRAQKLSDDRVERVGYIDEWLKGTIYAWTPEGCLD